MANPQRKKRTTTQLAKRQMKIAIYIRVSTHHQIDKDSLPFQREELTNYAKYVLGTEDIVIFEDAGYSAKNTDRPQYQDMMTRIRAGEFSHMLVWKLDRISRNLRDFSEMWDELKDLGVIFVSKMEQFDTSSAMGEAMLRIILVFAELERKLTAERVYSIMLSRANKGLWNGAPVPLGYDWDEETKTITINESEAEIVRQIYCLYEQYNSSTAVARWLLNNNKQTKRGGKWGSKGVVDILRNPIYAGHLRYNYKESGRGHRKDDDEVILVRDAVPAIIKSDQWERIQLQLDSNYKGEQSNRDTIYTHILSGLVRCGYCGKNYRAGRNTRPHKYNYHPSNYFCGTRASSNSCPAKSVSGMQIEPFVLEYIRAYLKAVTALSGDFTDNLMSTFNHEEIIHIDVPQEAIALSEAAATISPVMDQEGIDEITGLRQKKTKVEQALGRLDDAYYYGDGSVGKSEYLVRRAEFQQRLSQIDAEITVANLKQKPATAANVDYISRFLMVNKLQEADRIRDVLRLLDRQAAKDFVNSLISFIEVIDNRVIKIGFHSPQGEVVHQYIYRE